MRKLIMKNDFINSFKRSLRSKKLRYGGYSTLMTAVMAAILILINLVVGQLPFSADLTRNRLFSLSDLTKEMLQNLEQDIEIIGLYQTGNENPIVSQIIREYTDRTAQISFRPLDAIRHPQMIMRFQEDGRTIAQGSLIVVSGERFKIIHSHELINRRMNEQQRQLMPESLAIEQRLTAAIHYVTTEDLPVLYLLTGQDQAPLPLEAREQLRLENYRIENINLMTEESVPEDAHALLVISPQRDLTETEEQRLREYLGRQGRAIFLMDLLPEALPRFEGIFRSYGVELQRLFVVEGDAAMHVGNPLWLVPDMAEHSIVNSLELADMRVLLPVSQGIDVLDVRRRTLQIEPLLVTSQNSWGKTNLQSQVVEKEEGDVQGPFTVAVAVTDEVFENNEMNTTKLILAGSAAFLNAELTSQVPGNTNFLMNSLNWIQEREQAISIRPASLLSPRLAMNWLQQLIIAGIAVVLIPLLVLGAGLVVWLKRRHL